MDLTKPVRTYLDPDAVGPLPRSTFADDSDALAAARTMLRAPGSATQEIRPDDVLEVVDPNRPPSSIPPVGYDTAAFALPRRRLGHYVVSVLAVACVVLLAAVVRLASSASSEAAVPAAIAARPPQVPIATATTSPQPPVAQATVGTLRVDGVVEGQRVYVDGVALTAPAALLVCGPHDVAVGSPTHTRRIEVPCGGEVTIFR